MIIEDVQLHNRLIDYSDDKTIVIISPEPVDAARTGDQNNGSRRHLRGGGHRPD